MPTSGWCAGTCTRSFRRCAMRWRGTSSVLTTFFLAVPAPGSGQAVVQGPAGLPAEVFRDRRGVEVLAVDLAVRGALPPDVGLHVDARDLRESLDDLPDGHRRAGAHVPGAAAVGCVVERVGDRQVRVDCVLHI